MQNEVIQEEVQRLMKLHGGILPPAAVVEAARDENSPIHDYFDWDDSVAAVNWRLQQARQLIRVCVQWEERGKEPIKHRVAVSLSEDRKAKGGGYRLMVDVLADEELRLQLFNDARKELLRLREKYALLTELARVFEAIDSLEEAVEPATQVTEANP